MADPIFILLELDETQFVGIFGITDYESKFIKMAHPVQGDRNLVVHFFFGWCTEFVMIKRRTTDIPKFQNYEY